MLCQYCDNPIPPGVTNCPSCGAPVPYQAPQQPEEAQQEYIPEVPDQAPQAAEEEASLGESLLGLFVIGLIIWGIVSWIRSC